MRDPSLIRALALHAALTTGGELGALQRAERYVRLFTEFAESGDVAELRDDAADQRPEPGPLEAIRRAYE